MRCDVLLAALVTVATASPQQTFVVPAGLAQVAGNATNPWVFAHDTLNPWVPVHSQLVYATADIPPATANLRALAFRHWNRSYDLLPGSALLTVSISVGPFDPANALSIFPANQGANQATVFHGTVQTPRTPPPWLPSVFLAYVPFATPFPYAAAAGRGLVVDITTSTYALQPGINGSYPWALDAQAVDAGRAEMVGAGCASSMGRPWGLVSVPADLYPGAFRPVEFLFYDVPPGRLGVGFLSAKGPGAYWLGIHLPISLTAVGAPGCTLDVGATVALPASTTSRGNCSWPYPALPLPADPAIAGSNLYAQVALFDPAANAAGLTMSPSFRLPVRSGNLPRGTTITRLQDVSASPYGTLERKAVVAEFTY